MTLKNFGPIKRNTECPFAKSARLWGGNFPQNFTSLEDQAKANYAAFCHFVHQCNEGAKLDGFCIEIDHPLARDTTHTAPKGFGDCIRTVLTCLSDLDPSREFMMRVKYIGDRGWRFRFECLDFFVTTFAQCYPSTSCRYAFGTGRAFILLQPEISFLRHDLKADTLATNWDHPETMRDRVHVAYKKAGRPYYIPSTTKYPPAEHIVKPIQDDGTAIVRWWEPTSKKT